MKILSRRTIASVAVVIALVLVVLGAYFLLAKPAEHKSQFTEVTTDPRIKHHIVESRVTGVDYPVHVFLPENYFLEIKDYPVVYATDGQWLANLYRVLNEKDIILVAIEQGPNNRRQTDYGEGAEAYFQFVTTELLPYVEDQYRIDPRQRALIGTSIGGFFVGYALLVDDVDAPYFNVYGSFDGAFWFAEERLQEMIKARRGLNEKMNVTVFLTGAKEGNDRYVRRFQQDLEGAGYEGLKIISSTHNVKHEEIAYPSIVEMVDVIYSRIPADVHVRSQVDGCFTLEVVGPLELREELVLLDVGVDSSWENDACPCESGLMSYSEFQEKEQDVFSLQSGTFSVLRSQSKEHRVAYCSAVQGQLIFTDIPVVLAASCAST